MSVGKKAHLNTKKQRVQFKSLWVQAILKEWVRKCWDLMTQLNRWYKTVYDWDLREAYHDSLSCLSTPTRRLQRRWTKAIHGSDRQQSYPEMQSSSLSNFSSRVEASMKKEEVTVSLSLKVLRIRLNTAPRNLHRFQHWLCFVQEFELKIPFWKI